MHKAPRFTCVYECPKCNVRTQRRELFNGAMVCGDCFGRVVFGASDDMLDPHMRPVDIERIPEPTAHDVVTAQLAGILCLARLRHLDQQERRESWLSLSMSSRLTVEP